MSFVDLDGRKVARALTLVSDRPDDVVDAFFERRQISRWSQGGSSPGSTSVCEEGLAVRLVRGHQTFLASCDELGSEGFVGAVRRTVRRLPQGLLRPPSIVAAPPDAAVGTDELRAFAAAVGGELAARHLAFSMELGVSVHRRTLQVVDRELQGGVEREMFFAISATADWGRWGGLLPDLGPESAAEVARSLAAGFLSRRAKSPDPGRCPLLLGPSAAAVLLHEAVAHTLEVDTLARTGSPTAAIGVDLESELLDLLDDPSSGPEGLRRSSDDEGAPVQRRWLLRRGVVEAPISDRLWARDFERLLCGCARRQSRHDAPVPRSLHLELLPGAEDTASMARSARTGVFAAQASRGHLDERTGVFELRFPNGRRLLDGEPADRIGSFAIRARVGDLLGRIRGVGSHARFGGAGWCAKGGQKLPVWSTTPSLLFEDAEIVP